MYWIWLVHWCCCYIDVMVCELESCDLKSWVQKATIHCAPPCVKFFLNPSGLVHPILVYHNFRIKSNLLAQRRSTCKIKSDPNYIPQTFHSGTNLAQSKFDKRARSEFACQFACQFACSEAAAVWSQIKAFSRPNLRAKLVLQIYGQKRLDRKTTLPKFDTSKIWQRRQHRILPTERAAGFYRKANLESPQY